MHVLKHPDYVRCISFSPDSSKIASGFLDGAVRVWDVKSGQVTSVFYGHTDTVLSVAFSHNGKFIASGSEDGTIRIWRVEDRTSACECTSSCSAIGSWVLGEDGWIRSKPNEGASPSGGSEELLMWIPPDLRGTLHGYRNTAVLGPEFSTKLDFRNAAIGRRWRECFRPS